MKLQDNTRRRVLKNWCFELYSVWRKLLKFHLDSKIAQIHSGESTWFFGKDQCTSFETRSAGHLLYEEELTPGKRLWCREDWGRKKDLMKRLNAGYLEFRQAWPIIEVNSGRLKHSGQKPNVFWCEVLKRRWNWQANRTIPFRLSYLIYNYQIQICHGVWPRNPISFSMLSIQHS